MRSEHLMPQREAGHGIGTVPAMAAEVTAAVRKVYHKVLMVKLSANVTSIGDLAKAVANSSADVITLINTLPGMAIDSGSRCFPPSPVVCPDRPSSPSHCAWYGRCKGRHIPVIGLGGIMNATDAIEFLLAGATAIQVGTANFIDRRSP